MLLLTRPLHGHHGFNASEIESASLYMAVKLVERVHNLKLMTRELFDTLRGGRASEQRVILCTMYIVDHVKFWQSGLGQQWPNLAQAHAATILVK